MRLLAIRPRSRREVERALQLRGCLPDTVEMVIYKLEKEKLLDDAEFASVWAQARSQQGIGRSRIRQELRMKGVDSETAEAALNGLNSETEDQQTLEVAEKLLRRYHELTPSDAIRKALTALPYEMVQLRRAYVRSIEFGPRRTPPGGRFAEDAVYRAHPDAPRPPIPEECLKRSYE